MICFFTNANHFSEIAVSEFNDQERHILVQTLSTILLSKNRYRVNVKPCLVLKTKNADLKYVGIR